MRNDRLESEKTKKRNIEEEEGGDGEEAGQSETVINNKRIKLEEDERLKEEEVKKVVSSIFKLPVELLYSIHLYAKNPAFTLVNRHLYSIFTNCPVSIKAKYLIARWHEAYCYGFYPTSKAKKAKTKLSSAAATSGAASKQHEDKTEHVVSTPSRDLLQYGAMTELTWSSRFLPIIPIGNWTHPFSQSSQRSADIFILNFCLRYPICDNRVLRSIEDIVLSSSEFGNIVLATGLWEKDGELCTYEVFHGGESSNVKPCHLMVSELPKRLFGGYNEMTLEDRLARESGQLNKSKLRYLEVFGAGPYPSLSSLLLLLEIISLHFAYSLDSYTPNSNPVNCFEGLPLAKSTFHKSQFMVQLLLCLGADPSLMKSMSLLIAIRNGWLEGLQTIVERDHVNLEACNNALREIRAMYLKESNLRRSSSNLDITKEIIDHESDEPFVQVVPKKRRKLTDRIHLNAQMLKEAVKHSQWPIVNWINITKKVKPDMRTLHLITLKDAKQSNV